MAKGPNYELKRAEFKSGKSIAFLLGEGGFSARVSVALWVGFDFEGRAGRMWDFVGAIVCWED